MSILNIFIFRQQQVQRANLTANTNHANPFFERQLALLVRSFRATGSQAVQASHQALAQLSALVDRQAAVLGCVNAFWLLSAAVVCLIPLVSLLQKPSKAHE